MGDKNICIEEKFPDMQGCRLRRFLTGPKIKCCLNFFLKYFLAETTKVYFYKVDILGHLIRSGFGSDQKGPDPTGSRYATLRYEGAKFIDGKFPDYEGKNTKKWFKRKFFFKENYSKVPVTNWPSSSTREYEAN
jgi:hypothetical protein